MSSGLSSEKDVIVSNGLLEFEILSFWRDEETGVSGEILLSEQDRGTQRVYSSKPLEHSIVNRILVFKR